MGVAATPNGWMVYFMENPSHKWMIWRDPHDLGNFQLRTTFSINHIPSPQENAMATGQPCNIPECLSWSHPTYYGLQWTLLPKRETIGWLRGTPMTSETPKKKQSAEKTRSRSALTRVFRDELSEQRALSQRPEVPIVADWWLGRWKLRPGCECSWFIMVYDDNCHKVLVDDDNCKFAAKFTSQTAFNSSTDLVTPQCSPSVNVKNLPRCSLIFVHLFVRLVWLKMEYKIWLFPLSLLCV